MADLFNIGTSALLTYQRAIATTGHNVANVSTPGYSRQVVDFATRPPQGAGALLFGSGVELADVRRSYDAFITAELRAQSAALGQADTVAALGGRLGALVGDPAGGLAPALGDTFGALRTLAGDPASLPTRQAVFDSLDALAGRFRTLSAGMDSLASETAARMAGAVDTVNALARDIAELNARIVNASGPGGSPNDLLDQRDALLLRLSQQVSVRTTVQDDGALNVYVGNGQALVVGQNAQSLTTAPGTLDARATSVYYVGNTGTGALDGALTGGVLGGLVEFRDQVLTPARAQLDQLAAALGGALNDAHRLGMDLHGQFGQGLVWNLAGPRPAAPAAGNTGSAALGITLTDPAALPASDYQARYDAGAWTVTRLSDGQATVFASLPATLDGFTVDLSGVPADGDRFYIRPAGDAARDFGRAIGDPTQLAAALPVRSAADGANTGSGRIAQPAVTALPVPQTGLTAPVNVTFTSPTAYTVTGTGAGLPAAGVYDPATGAVLAFNGWRVQLSGAPAPGDVFRIEASTGGVSDGRGALALAAVGSAALLPGGADVAGGYGALVTRVGSATAQAQGRADTHGALQADAQARREGISGVNLDEEAARLLELEQVYQAAAQVLATADRLFDSLLGALAR